MYDILSLTYFTHYGNYIWITKAVLAQPICFCNCVAEMNGVFLVKTHSLMDDYYLLLNIGYINKQKAIAKKKDTLGYTKSQFFVFLENRNIFWIYLKIVWIMTFHTRHEILMTGIDMRLKLKSLCNVCVRNMLTCLCNVDHSIWPGTYFGQYYKLLQHLF